MDELLGGLQPGHLVVAAAEPQYGIQTFLLGVVAHVAAHLRRPVAILTVTASRAEIARRLAAVVTGDGGEESPRTMPAAERTLLANRAEALLHMLPVAIAESAGALPQLAQTATALRAQRPYDLLLVLGPLEALSSRPASPPTPCRSATDEALAIATELKRLACDLGVPLLVQSGLSPRIQMRLDQRPMLSDLPARGAISRVSDATVFLCSTEPLGLATRQDLATQIIIPQNRHGAIGTAMLHLTANRGRFESR
jgi:replicative DNA helicase